MSRTLVKDPEADTPVELPPLGSSGHPNYITPQGHARLLARLAVAEQRLALVPEGQIDSLVRRAHIGLELRWLQSRMECAVPIDPACQPRDQIGFGSRMELMDEHGTRHRYEIVGEDETDPGQGRVSWVSPLAKALLGARVGDHVIWQRPAGELDLEVVAIAF